MRLVELASTCKSQQAKIYKDDKPRGPIPEMLSVPPSIHSRYDAAALEKEIEKVRAAPEGTRNDILNRAAFSMGTLVASGQLKEGDVAASLRSAAVEAGLSEKEIDATIRSGLGAGKVS